MFYPSDFDHRPVREYVRLFEKHGLIIGRMITGSKYDYSKRYPEHLIVFNANAIIKSVGKIWHGDLDLTFDAPILRQIADVLEEPIYILSEMEARFGNENKPVIELIDKALWATNFDWEPTLENYCKIKGIDYEKLKNI